MHVLIADDETPARRELRAAYRPKLRASRSPSSHSGLIVEQVIKQRGKAGHSQMQVLTNLAGHRSGLLDEVPPMSRSELEFPIG